MTIGWREGFNGFVTIPHEPCGTLEDWSSAANMLFAKGCEAQSFMLLASFAAPLMAMFSCKDGGAVVSIHGGRRSGKTTAINAAASVWGLPEDYVISNLSMRRKYENLARLRHLPAIDSGLGKGDPEIAKTFINGFVGIGTAWQTLILRASGEPLIGPVFQSASQFPGVEFEVDVPRGLISAKDGDHIEGRLLSNRGTAGAAYLHYIANPETSLWCHKKVSGMVAEIRDKTGLGDERIHAMRAIGAVHVAGLIVSDQGIIEVEVGRITEWAFQKTFPKPAVPAKSPPAGP